MIQTKQKSTIWWLVTLLATLICAPLYGQRREYSPTEIEELINSADTVIYRYTEAPLVKYRLALAREYDATEFDWEVDTSPRRPLFALKTNLLFDAVSAINIELEVPIGERYSVSGEWIFPWWLSDSRQRCFELLCGTIEGRYWFGDRRNMEQLTGWAAGLYFGCGYYDVEWDRDGYQGEHLLSGGISASYAHPIGKCLKLEYSLGVGMFMTKYRKYRAQKCDNDWILLRTGRGTNRWFGPTRCRVSLSWMLHRADKRGGVR